MFTLEYLKEIHELKDLFIVPSQLLQNNYIDDNDFLTLTTKERSVFLLSGLGLFSEDAIILLFKKVKATKRDFNLVLLYAIVLKYYNLIDFLLQSDIDLTYVIDKERSGTLIDICFAAFLHNNIDLSDLNKVIEIYARKNIKIKNFNFSYYIIDDIVIASDSFIREYLVNGEACFKTFQKSLGMCQSFWDLQYYPTFKKTDCINFIKNNFKDKMQEASFLFSLTENEIQEMFV